MRGSTSQPPWLGERESAVSPPAASHDSSAFGGRADSSRAVSARRVAAGRAAGDVPPVPVPVMVLVATMVLVVADGTVVDDAAEGGTAGFTLGLVARGGPVTDAEAGAAVTDVSAGPPWTNSATANAMTNPVSTKPAVAASGNLPGRAGSPPGAAPPARPAA
ncbi:hypothetical protein I6A84_44170 [Frankia sp. CNm7]|uniref:Uncharacterized protein n=1 Tax=Frankia nepalensis TaxID=1836974 RepID=A0A937RLB1_9ACTN|nr:hypothetical protein [Frankia nepalensis]MBL7495190.1 hypothetical protein [Frankia nepalensis]MBL7510244.1 hypothetical protein [Frankia nepalensis]MBL7524854.1 hypothetical protein [Frankia nepalensis]MBL7632427.1 hypothetical protein [Frankia nepalensis]